jgi:hypothetical protein
MSLHRKCCCIATTTCTRCIDDTAAETYRAVITGVTNCGCVAEAGGGFATTTGDINGTWDLTLNAAKSAAYGCCVWDVETDVTWDLYAAGNPCPGTPDFTYPYFVEYHACGTYVQFLRVRVVGDPGTSDDHLFYAYIDNGASKPDCMATANFTSLCTVCGATAGPSGPDTKGTGGTATVDPI